MKRLLTLLALLFVGLQLFAQNPDFDRKYQQAKALFEKGQFENARKSINSALANLPSLSQDQRTQGRKFIDQCGAAIRNRDRLNLPITEMSIGYQSNLDSVSFDAGKPNLVTATSSAAWCKVERVKNGQIFLRTEFNPDKQPRSAVVSVKMGKINSARFSVTQAARPETEKRVVITTVPDRARISVDGGDPITGVWEGVLRSGQHKLRIEKGGYAVRDTVIQVADDMRSEQQMDVKLKLAPQFAQLKLDIRPEEGFTFNSEPVTLYINGVMVDLNPSVVYSFDDDRDIQRYCLYQDGILPVSTGRLDITAAVNYFEPFKTQIQVKAGEVKPLTIELKAITGYLSLINVRQATDATVILDGREVGTVEQMNMYRTTIGDHSIVLRKDGFLPAQESYPVHVEKDLLSSVEVKMSRFVPYVFTSDPEGARVSLNGDFVDLTPTQPVIFREDEVETTFTVDIAKDGFMPVTRHIQPVFGSTDTVTVDAKLLAAQPFTLKTDSDLLTAVIKNGKQGDTTFVDHVPVPADLALPLRNSPYYLELRRALDDRVAYAGRFTFDNPEKNSLYILSWSEAVFHAINANFYLAGMPQTTIGLQNKPYSSLGYLNLGSITLFNGFSSSIARMSAFMAKDQTALEVTDNTGATATVDKSTKFMPAFSILFLNGEFRVGGAVLPYMDVDVLATYAWYPNLLKSVVGINHITGHDIFLGAEVSSRIPIANVNLKIGYQMYKKLEAHIFYDNSAKSVADGYVTLPLSNLDGQFVISLGFTLGSRKSKGNNILRVF